jgi:Tol biopolymer transport system component
MNWQGFSFHPTKAEITFSESAVFDQTATADLYRLDLSDGGVHQLTSTADVSERIPLWSPNGDLLVYATDEGLTLLDSAGGTQQLKVPAFSCMGCLTWSPNEQWLLFLGRYTDARVRLVRVDDLCVG